MPNLEGIGLQNFRTFSKKENLEFGPITIITGSNNAGKSSVFKAIQFMVHNYKDGIVSQHLDFKNMQHELGNMERIFNRAALQHYKDSNQQSEQMYSRISNFHQKYSSQTMERPIFEDNSDLVFAFPIKIGGSREIDATLEIRYGLYRFIHRKGAVEEDVVNHDIKSIAIVRKGKYLHWSNVIGFRYGHEEADYWEMSTSIDLKEIIRLILKNPLKEMKKSEPDQETVDICSINLFRRIDKYKSILLEKNFFSYERESYSDFLKKRVAGKSIFSNYSGVSEQEKSKLSEIEEMVTTALLKGKENNHEKILDCFHDNFSRTYDGVCKDIVIAESTEEQHSPEGAVQSFLESPWFKTTDNSDLYSDLSQAIEKDFTEIVKKKVESLNRIHFLPTARGRNRAWFIDEQNGEDVQIVKDFTSIYLESYPQIQDFVNFWIGAGEVRDKNGDIKYKGFNIGKELSVVRDESIGLTKIFLVNFDGTKTALVDLGYGVSQLLPIILKIATLAFIYQRNHEYNFNHNEGYYEKEAIYFMPSTLLIEEPEANLHPSLQSKMAELFIDASSRFNIQFLIETHSEYLIYKFQEYIGNKLISPSEVKMYYFNQPHDVLAGFKKNYISHVKIDKDGSIDYEQYFGRGFFDEQNNLKLSLFNIQRNHFIEDYDEIKEKLIASNQSLEQYDRKLEQLHHEMEAAYSDHSKLKEEINEVKRQKGKIESELQLGLKQQQLIIDRYLEKTDYSKYVAEVKLIVDERKIDNNKTLQYLATGKFLLITLDNNADFAPVVIQFGRAVEFEMIKWMNDFTNYIDSSNVTIWSEDAHYKDKINHIIDNLPLARGTGNSTILINGNNVMIDHLKNYSKNSTTEYKFGNLTQIFELLHSISPTSNAMYNYNSVPLVLEFSNFLRSSWRDYNNAESLFGTFRYIKDLRNCAGHTYNDTICTQDVIDRNTAEDYIGKVLAIFKYL
ncbi:DUF3696 domain-containing protein [Sphingobacterium multivorum]|uniref:DUF3696 domain-containing protein n=1 Tax=Sphingobacterium multivorum TaxID=28454 RepID=UPI00289DC5A6|nr:DUF3696 domain-containing protein [Sphingobacterium multivorum]